MINLLLSNDEQIDHNNNNKKNSNNKVMVGGEKRERDNWANPSLADPICRCVKQPNTTQYNTMIKKKKKILALFGNFEKEIDSLQLFSASFGNRHLLKR